MEFKGKKIPQQVKKTKKWGLKELRNVSGTDLQPISPKMQLSSTPRPYMSSTSSYETSSTNSDFSGYISSETPPPEIRKRPYLKKSRGKQSNRGEGAELHLAMSPIPQVIIGEGVDTHLARSTSPKLTVGFSSKAKRKAKQRQAKAKITNQKNNIK